MQNSPLFDEPRHLIAGACHLSFQRFDIYRVTTPLPRMVTSLAVVLVGPEIDWRSFKSDVDFVAESVIAREYLKDHAAEFRTTLILARILCIPFAIIGALVCSRWAKEMFGAAAGMLALTFWCASPLIQGCASTIMPDVAAASMIVCAGWRFWHWLKQPSVGNLFWATLALGTALLCRTTAIIAFPVWLLSFAVCRWQKSPERPPTVLGFVLLGIGSIYILNLGYLFQGSMLPLGEYRFVSETFGGAQTDSNPQINYGNRFQGTWFGNLPVPLPQPYLEGIDFLESEYEGGMRSYLRGRWKEHGWWYYYLYCLLVKCSIPEMLLAFASVLTFLLNGRRAMRPFESVLLLGFATVFLAVQSCHSGLSHHVRYLLPAFPFAFIFISQIANHVATASRVKKSLFVVLIFWLLTDGLFCHPHQLSYFNELIGGPRQGYKHLLESNIDWGQDLYHLDNWIRKHAGFRPTIIDYYGFAEPEEFNVCSGANVLMETVHGTRLETLLKGKEPFLLCVSVGIFEREDRYDFLRGRTPDYRVGYSILVFELGQE